MNLFNDAHAFKRGDMVKLVYMPDEAGFDAFSNIPMGAVPGWANNFSESMWLKPPQPEGGPLVVSSCNDAGVRFQNWPYSWPTSMFTLIHVPRVIKGYVVSATYGKFSPADILPELFSTPEEAHDALEDMLEMYQISQDPKASRESALIATCFPAVFSFTLRQEKV